jgi:protein phosphatase
MRRAAQFSFDHGDKGIRVFAVADGLGGHSSGEVASQFALARLSSSIAEAKEVSDQSLRESLRETHKALYIVSKADLVYREMGSTVAGLVVDEAGRVHLFHVGDSRIYRRQERFLEKATVDDRLESGGYGDGHLESGTGSSLLQCLGGAAEYSEIEPHIARFEMADVQETFLLCSDGLWAMLTQDEIEQSMSDSLEQTVADLLERVNAAGAKDNVSIILVRLTPSAEMPHGLGDEADAVPVTQVPT